MTGPARSTQRLTELHRRALRDEPSQPHRGRPLMIVGALLVVGCLASCVWGFSLPAPDARTKLSKTAGLLIGVGCLGSFSGAILLLIGNGLQPFAPSPFLVQGEVVWLDPAGFTFRLAVEDPPGLRWLTEAGGCEPADEPTRQRLYLVMPTLRQGTLDLQRGALRKDELALAQRVELLALLRHKGRGVEAIQRLEPA